MRADPGEACPVRAKTRPKDTKPYLPLFKALADETRLKIVGLLAGADGALCVCDIETHVADVSQPTISHHLRQLREAQLVTAERRATWIYYAIDKSTVAKLSAFAQLFGTDALAPASSFSNRGLTKEGRSP
jgi:ArsR family transcriptional regulator, arsenate/arsenite/antimonite-responsive transcriptional repressor